MKAWSSVASASIRVLSPRIEPPERLERRVDGEHRDLVAGGGELRAQRPDERRLADPGHPGDPDPPRTARVGEQLDEQFLGGVAVVGAGGLDEGDRPPDPQPRPRTDALDVGRQVDVVHVAPTVSALDMVDDPTVTTAGGAAPVGRTTLLGRRLSDPLATFRPIAG